MSSTTWTPPAVSSEARPWRATAWRVVEAQHLAATMKLVDSPYEQDLLEALLDRSKPPVPDAARELDYLLATPFRYPPREGGSRFRGATDPGVFYGAGSVRTACSELGYWRWRFLHDSPALERLEPVAHTAFRATVATDAIDLRSAPFATGAPVWTDPADYRATQALARACRDAGLGAIVYTSVRDPRPGWCVAVLDPRAFARRAPLPGRQTWWLAVARDRVTWRRRDEALDLEMTRWEGVG